MSLLYPHRATAGRSATPAIVICLVLVAAAFVANFGMGSSEITMT